MSTNFHPKFEKGLFYHVYNRTNNQELLFRNDENFNYFLKRYKYFLNAYLDMVAYCLMPTHFHFLVRVKSEIPIHEERHDISDSGENHDPVFRNVISVSKIIEEQFRKFFISYSKSYNVMYNRHGSLLQRPFKRVHLENENKVIDKIYYIHHNPIHHGYCENYNEWKYSTYNNFISDEMNQLINKEMINANRSAEEWIQVHQEYKENFSKKQNLPDKFEE